LAEPVNQNQRIPASDALRSQLNVHLSCHDFGSGHACVLSANIEEFAGVHRRVLLSVLRVDGNGENGQSHPGEFHNVEFHSMTFTRPDCPFCLAALPPPPFYCLLTLPFSRYLIERDIDSFNGR
jgi:hypothetical protein